MRLALEISRLMDSSRTALGKLCAPGGEKTPGVRVVRGACLEQDRQSS